MAGIRAYSLWCAMSTAAWHCKTHQPKDLTLVNLHKYGCQILLQCTEGSYATRSLPSSNAYRLRNVFYLSEIDDGVRRARTRVAGTFSR